MTPRCLKTVRLQQVYRLSVRMLCLGVSRLLPQGESLIQPDRIPKMRVLEGLSPTRTLHSFFWVTFRLGGHSDRNPNSGDAQVLGTKVRK